MQKEDVTLIITACIMPNINMKFLTLVDKDIRLQQYIESLRFYIEKTSLRNIVFGDNSDYPYDFGEEKKLAQKHNKNLEIFSFSGDAAKAVNQGKGYGEGEILNYIFKHSELIRNKMCIKVTGRLKVLNIESIVKRIKANRIYMNNNLFGLGSVDTRCYAIGEEKYRKYYLEEYKKVNDEQGVSIEVVFAAKNKQIKEKIYNIPVYPVISGISGSSGLCYEKEGKMMSVVGSFLSICNIYNSKLAGKIMLRIRGDKLYR